MPEAKAIIISGSPVDGFRHIGPFDDAADALAYAELDRATRNDNYWIVGLERPRDDVDFSTHDDSCCAGCDVCGTHCISQCPSGEGERCTVSAADETQKNLASEN